MDQRLTSEAGRDIATWVKQDGWDSFRRSESSLLGIISGQKGLVVATGGGIVLHPQSRRVLRKHFFTVWLKATPQTIYARLSSDPGSLLTRPSLSELPMEEEIVKMLSERKPLYAQVAIIEVDTEGKQSIQIADEIVALLRLTL
jgi:shikimate kinase